MRGAYRKYLFGSCSETRCVVQRSLVNCEPNRDYYYKQRAYLLNANTLSTALSAAIITPMTGLVVRGGTILASMTNKFCMPVTFVSASTQDSIRELLHQCCTLLCVYALGLVTQVVGGVPVELFVT